MAAKTYQIPVFPLDIFLLPGDRAQLFIFENKFKQLVNDSVDDKHAFAIAFNSVFNTQNYGSLVEVSEVIQHYNNGEMDILVEAKAVVKLDTYAENKANGKLYQYINAHTVEAIKDAPASAELLEKFKRFLIENKQFNANALVKKDSSLLDIAHEMGMDNISKLEMLHLKTVGEIQTYLMQYIRFLELIIKQEKSAVFQGTYIN